MKAKDVEAGADETPDRNGSITIDNNDVDRYINCPLYIDRDFLELQQNPLIKMYAEVGPDTYEIISRTNPVLKAVVDLVKDICGGGQ